MFLIYSLIVFFIFLITYQLFLAWNPHIMEGLVNNTNNIKPVNVDYRPYDLNNPNNALILGQQNAGNIEFLKGRIKEVDDVNSRLDGLEQNVDSMQTQLDALVQQQANFANDINEGEPIDISDEKEDITDIL
jgi:hypothetical protein